MPLSARRWMFGFGAFWRALMSAFFVVFFIALFVALDTHAAALLPDEISPAIESRIDYLIGQMTLDEKISLLAGTGFDTVAIARLGIPSIRMTDGPLGVRWEKATAFPAGIAMGATFDPTLIEDVGVAIADEARVRGRNMLLGPCINISRHPFGGRNFESFGEDPLLTGRLGASYIKGIQSRNVLPSVKHFAANDQEYERMTIDAHVDLRTLFEIYLPPFKDAVDAGAWNFMAAYNRINGFYATENDFLQNTVLKNLWGFKGFIVSDWGATHSTVESALRGLDLEMPTPEFFGPKLKAAVIAGQVSVIVIDDKLRRILRAMFAVGLIDPALVSPAPKALGPESREHQRLAMRVAEEGTVLLKNDSGLLPLKNLKTLAVIGPNANRARTGGGGSSHVTPFRVSTPLQGLTKRLERIAKVRFAAGMVTSGEMTIIPSRDLRPAHGSPAHGLRAEFFSNPNLQGQPVLSRVDTALDFDIDREDGLPVSENFSVRWSGEIHAPENGEYTISTSSDDGIRVLIDGHELISDWHAHVATVNSAKVTLTGHTWHSIVIEYFNAEGSATARLGWILPHVDPLSEAVELARTSDAAVIFAGLGEEIESEGLDRTSMDLPAGQAELIRAVASANPNTTVVLNSGNPVSMSSWIGEVKALLQAWYPGQEGGFALADILLGNINPSGKLPVSFLKRWEDSPAYGNYPGTNGVVDYKEGIFVGYRHYDRAGTDVEFPFGFGLSYTTFAYSGLKLQARNAVVTAPDVRVEFDVRNGGGRIGAEVAQIYVSENSPSVPRPLRELKGFTKMRLEPGETKHVTLDLDARAFQYFDESLMVWRVNPGRFTIHVGSSSRDLKMSETVDLL